MLDEHLPVSMCGFVMAILVEEQYGCRIKLPPTVWRMLDIQAFTQESRAMLECIMAEVTDDGN